MAGSKTDAFETRILNLVFKNTGTSLVAGTCWIGLFTTVPSDSSAGVEVLTTGGTAYARKATVAADWTLTGGQVTNATEIAFTAVGAAYAGPVVGWGVFDAVTAGNLLYWGDTTSTALSIGDIARFAPGAIIVTED